MHLLALREDGEARASIPVAGNWVEFIHSLGRIPQTESLNPSQPQGGGGFGETCK